MVSNSTSFNIEESFKQNFESAPKAVMISDQSVEDVEAAVEKFLMQIDKMDEKDLWPAELLPPVRVLLSSDGIKVLDLGYRVIMHVPEAHLSSEAGKEMLQKILKKVGIDEHIRKQLIEQPPMGKELVITRERVEETPARDESDITHYNVRRGEELGNRWTVYLT